MATAATDGRLGVAERESVTNQGSERVSNWTLACELLNLERWPEAEPKAA